MESAGTSPKRLRASVRRLVRLVAGVERRLEQPRTLKHLAATVHDVLGDVVGGARADAEVLQRSRP